MNDLKVGVIGVGTMGQRHCRVYSNMGQVQLVGVCDANQEVGQQVADQYQAPFFDEIEQLLERVDAVSVVTPTPLHFELTMRCLSGGVHVLIEKPITETLRQAETLTEMADASNLVVQVGHIERFNPTYMELKNVLDNVNPLVINMRRLSPYERSNRDVDVVLDLMIHDIDLILDLMGREPISVEAHGLTASGGAVDHAITQLSFEAAPLVTLTASRVTEQKVRSVDVTALEAYVEGDLLNKSISIHRRTFGEYLSHSHRGVKYRQESVVERIHVPMFEPLFLELQHFVESVIEGKPSLVPPRAGLQALRLTTTIRNIICEKLIYAPVVNGTQPA